MNRLESQQVAWMTVSEFVGPVLGRVGSWPMAGTPAWCALADDDPTKIAALFDAARHWALRLDALQESLCEASRAISAAHDWSAFAQRNVQREAFFEARPYLRRVAG